MDITISRILKYLNGCLDNDYMYKIGNYIVRNYTKMKCITFEEFLNEGKFSKEEVLDFCKHLGYHTYEEFQEKLWLDHQMRLSQIQLRMLDMDLNPYLSSLNISSTKEEFLDLIDELCDLIFKNNRVVIVGSLYPSCVAVDFQTDFISFGKEVVEYHQFDKNFQFKDDDVVFIVTATGRTMETGVKRMVPQNICQAYMTLITQNIKYKNFDNVCADYVIHVLGKFDGLQFNYQIMMIFDLLRIRYYYKFYL